MACADLLYGITDTPAACTPSFSEPRAYVKLDESLVMRREWNTLSPNGNVFNGHWVLRGPDGEFIDHDSYRSDLAERHGIELVWH